MPGELNSEARTLLEKTGARVHLIGVAGSGMSGLARLLLQQGHAVSGSDLNETDEIKQLEKLGLKYFSGHKAENVNGSQLVVFSSAVVKENPERQEAEKQKLGLLRRAECLALLAEKKKVLLICGMHGKTTSTSMLAHVLRTNGSQSSHYVGAEIPILGTSASWEAGDYFVIEGDESDGTLTLYHPYASLILNIEEEHLDHFRNLDEIKTAFAQVRDQTSKFVFYCAENENAFTLCRSSPKAISYGFSEKARYRAVEIEEKPFSSNFKISKENKILGEVSLPIPGRQNISNACGITAFALELGLDFEIIKAAFAKFKGAKRRFEVKYKSEDFMLVDDYAHHPTEIKATLAAAKNCGYQRVIVAFQPHRYTRTQLLLNEFADAFQGAQHIFVTDIYAASEKPIEGISGESIVKIIKVEKDQTVQYEPSLARLEESISKVIKSGDLVLIMGAGDIYKTAAQLSKNLMHFVELKKQLKPASVLLQSEPLSKHTSMRIGGPADLWFEPTDENDLAIGLRYAKEHHLPVTLIGRGTNLLIRDRGIRGLCIHLGQPYFSRVEVQGDSVVAGAGVRLKNIVAEAKKQQLGGFEFMEGIPGNLGGALRMNAGAMQGWTMEVVEEITSMDMEGNRHVIPRSELEVHYRRVPHFEQHIALSARLRGQQCPEKTVNEKLKTYSEKRWSSQPAAPSAGCIFKNPGPLPAGKLIDELGLKNLSVGKARVSEVHGNFIVNDGGAKAEEVLQLIELIKEKAKTARQIELETEVIVLGEPA